MKKQRPVKRNLQLHRETLVRLTERSLEGVGGAGPLNLTEATCPQQCAQSNVTEGCV